MKKLIALLISVSTLITSTCFTASATEYNYLKLINIELVDTYGFATTYSVYRNKSTNEYYHTPVGSYPSYISTLGIDFDIYLFKFNEDKAFEYYNINSENFIEYINTNYPDFKIEKEILEDNDYYYRLKLTSDKELTEDEKWQMISDIYTNTGCKCATNRVEDALFTVDTMGDANTDCSINVSDVVAVLANVANSKTNPLEELSITNGDVHEKGNGLNSSDAFMIQQYVTGVIESL